MNSLKDLKSDRKSIFNLRNNSQIHSNRNNSLLRKALRKAHNKNIAMPVVFVNAMIRNPIEALLSPLISAQQNNQLFNYHLNGLFAELNIALNDFYHNLVPLEPLNDTPLNTQHNNIITRCIVFNIEALISALNQFINIVTDYILGEENATTTHLLIKLLNKVKNEVIFIEGKPQYTPQHTPQ